MELNTIYNEDCLETMKRMADKSVDLVLTDPPYGIDFVPQRGTFEGIANDKQEDAKILWEKFIPETERILKDNTFAFFSIGWTEMDWVLPILKKHFTVKSCIVWHKNMFGIGYYTRPQHELNILCLKGKPKPPEVAPSDVWSFAKVRELNHSCEKPVELLRTVLKNYSKEGDIVIDPFIGSGSTAVACKLDKRNYIGCEISKEYCDIAEQRIKSISNPLF